MNLSNYIDHTLLKPDAILDDIRKLCQEAIEYQFASVCVSPYYVKHAAEFLKDEPVKVSTVIGFPMGYSTTAAKVEEIKRAIDDGGDELDVVINITALKNGDWSFVKNDVDSMATIARMRGKVVKVIIEAGLLTEDEIRRMCKICKDSGVDYVKTSTGYLGEGATVGVIQFLHSLLPKEIKIKASGGIRTVEDTKRLIEAGAARIGTSAGVLIMNEK